jgi:N-acyl-D-aspartate/D-glutamate deacylase
MRTVSDLPGSCQRMLQLARGYRATLVAGTAIVTDDRLTGERPGRLMRAGSRPPG